MIRDRPGTALLYHDVVPNGSAADSGIVTDGSWRYKISPERFHDHLRIIDDSPHQVTILPADEDRPLLLTFDDGGLSCAETVAPMLEDFGIRGHFFMITNRLGEDGYVSREQARQLAEAGHHVGSHTMTHANLRRLSRAERRHELNESKLAIENILGQACDSLSVPGGFADRSVIEDAFQAGYEYIFVSEPRYLSWPLTNEPLGRWNVWHDTTTSDLRNILERAWLTRLQVQGRWYVLKTVKRTIGQDRFERLRSPFIS